MTESTVLTGSISFLKELKKRSFKSAEGIVQFISAEELTEKYLEDCLFEYPIIVLNPEGLGMRIPPYNDYQELVQHIGENHIFELVDSAKQVHIYLPCQKFIDHMKKDASKRKKILNLISCECSNLPLGNLIEPPDIVRKIDFVRKYADHPDFGKITLRSVEKYCLISGKNSFTDFHIDFSGTSVWYHMVKGTKEFFLIRPTEANLKLYWQWNDSRSMRTTFFADQVENCYKFTLTANSTLFLPCGWIHAVLTTEDSLVYGGNYLHHFNIPRQLEIYVQEKKHKICSKQIYPYYVDLQWFIANVMCKEVDTILTRDTLPPMYIISGLKVLKHTLRKWNSDSLYSSTYSSPDDILKRLGATLRRINKLQNKVGPKEPRRESSRLKRKRNFEDYVTETSRRRSETFIDDDFINTPSTSGEGNNLGSAIQHSLEGRTLPELIKAGKLPPLRYNYREGSRHKTSPVNTDDEELAKMAQCKPVRILVEKLRLSDFFKQQNNTNNGECSREEEIVDDSSNSSASPLFLLPNNQEVDNDGSKEIKSRSNSPSLGLPETVQEGAIRRSQSTDSFRSVSSLPPTNASPEIGDNNVFASVNGANTIYLPDRSCDSEISEYTLLTRPKPVERMMNGDEVGSKDGSGDEVTHPDVTVGEESRPSVRGQYAEQGYKPFLERLSRLKEVIEIDRINATHLPPSPIPTDDSDAMYNAFAEDLVDDTGVPSPAESDQSDRAEADDNLSESTSSSSSDEEEENTSGSDSDEQVVTTRTDSDVEQRNSTRDSDSDGEQKSSKGSDSDGEQKSTAGSDSDNEQRTSSAGEDSDHEEAAASESGSDEEQASSRGSDSVNVERLSPNTASEPREVERQSLQRTPRDTDEDYVVPEAIARLPPLISQSPTQYHSPTSSANLQSLQIEELLLRLKNIIDTNYRNELIDLLNNSDLFQQRLNTSSEDPFVTVSGNLSNNQGRMNSPGSKLIRYSCGHFSCSSSGILSALEHDPGRCSECLEKLNRVPRAEPEVIDIASSSDEEADVISQDNDFVYLAVNSTENEDAEDTLWSPSSRHLKVDPKGSRPAREGIKKRKFSGGASGTSTADLSTPQTTLIPSAPNSQVQAGCDSIQTVYNKKVEDKTNEQTNDLVDTLAQPSTSGCSNNKTVMRKKRAKTASKKSTTESRRKRKLTTAKQRLGKILKLF